MRRPPILGSIKAEWQRFTQSLPGERFIEYYERHQARASEGLLALTYFATVFCVGMAIVLCFVTGPAWIYWLLSAVLLPGEPRKVAIGFDRVERAIHRLLKPRATPSTPPPTAAQRPERRVKDPRAVWLDTPAGGARRPSAMGRTQKLWAPEPPSTRTPPPAPIDRRTPTPT